MEGHVSNELIGIIGAAITVAAVFLATMRGIRGDMREIRGEVRDVRTEMKNSLESAVNGLKEGDSRLHDAMNDSASSLRDEMNDSTGKLRAAIDDSASSLRDEMNDSAGKLREEMNAGFKEITSRLVNVGDRLSKVEGIIEGMFWSARNQPPDKPRAGAA